MLRPTAPTEGRSQDPAGSRSPEGFPWLPLLCAAALAIVLGLALYEASEAAPSARTLAPFGLAADTTGDDSTAFEPIAPIPLDTTGADSLVVDSLALDTLGLDSLEVVPDTGRAARLLPPFRPDAEAASMRPRRAPLAVGLGAYWERRVLLDSLENTYTVTERVDGADVRVPVGLDFDAYREARRRLGLEDAYRELVEQRTRRTQRRGDLSLLNIEIPGGRRSAFAGIFGSNEVDLRVNGQANIDLGFAYRKNEQQEAATGRGGRIDPDFGQELGLGITGTIGEKLQINVNYDTQNDFDFQNQVRLTYTGYEDDIIQNIEAGNVFLQTPSDLIQGGQRLFGIRSDLRLGGLGLTVVASQQDAESDELVLEGGSQATTFSLRPTDYEDNAHFYLGYYFHNRWDEAHASPPNIRLGPDFREVSDIEVFLFERQNVGGSSQQDDLYPAIALADLAEPETVLEGGQAYLEAAGPTPPLPDPLLDRYTDEDLERLRDRENNNLDLGAEFGLAPADYFESSFRKLRDDEYSLDKSNGTVSLRRSLQENEAIAVAYRYRRADGTPVTVGDFGQGSGSGNQYNGPRIVLKLLRGPNPQPATSTWDLTMRNIYRIGGSNINPADFQLQIAYAPGGQTPQRTLPGVDIGRQQKLLQTLGLDRVDPDGARRADEAFDFLQGYTIRPGEGRILFPYRQPFGSHLARVLRGEFTENGERVPVSYSGISEEEALARFVFEDLYTLKQTNAAQQTARDVYRIEGEFRGGVQEVYDLGFAIVENSVTVKSGNIELTEGTDYIVDYATGTVTITNPTYLTHGRDVRIAFERNQFVAIQKKTLLGLRANYDFSDKFSLGATWMRLSERPLIDKYRLGEEPIANTIWGLDLRYAAEPRWMTSLVDALPLIQTRAPSAFEFKGEFARLSPGHPQTLAFEQSRENLRSVASPNARDFYDDELSGISYIDDFEGTENAYSLLQPGAWMISAAPEGHEGAPGVGPPGAITYDGDGVTDPALRASWRGLFGWYSIAATTYSNFARDLITPATEPVRIHEVYPDRQLERGTPQTLTTLDVYFDPTRRGPYNYNRELGTTFAEQPHYVWGGMAQRLPEGYTDFGGRNNIEFVEFIFAPYGGKDGREPIDPSARLVIDLGQVSEDIIPNKEMNSEDGLLSVQAEDDWGRPAGGTTDGIVNINRETMRTEDLGLDGLPSGITARVAAENGTPYPLTENEKFADFLEAIAADLAGTPAYAHAVLDPSADDFRSFQDNDYFNDPELFPGGATIQERFSQFFSGLELNSLEAQNLIAQRGTPGNSRLPDSEDLNLNGRLDRTERHFRYEIPLAPGLVDQPCAEGQTTGCNPFYVTTIHNPELEEAKPWILVRIPVRTDHKAAIGGIENFDFIEAIRMWTDGSRRPLTLRFASLDLVGSQWLKSSRVGIEDYTGGATRSDPKLFVATINNEKNPREYRIPRGAVQSYSRDVSGGPPVPTREQALVFRVEDLGEGQTRALFKPYSRRLDLTKYSNLRMFVHAHGFERRDSVRVVVRLGLDETDNYYEFEQPLYPFDPRRLEEVASEAQPDSLWQTNVPVPTAQGTRYLDLNSVNIEFDALNKLKIERDLGGPDGAPVPLDSVYTARSVPLDFAPPGAVLRIKGNPSVQDISTIVLGVKNGHDDLAATRSVELWFNELRVSGYDEEPGWSGYARVAVRLADFVDFNARYDRETSGFGSLASTLGERTFSDREGYSATATVNLHKFLPERYGWRLPVNVSVQQSLSTPRFSPNRGDITVEQEIAQIREDSRLDEAQKEQRIAEVRAAAETASFSRTIRVPISKTGSRSPLLRYTLDGLAFTYTNTQRSQRTPAQQRSDADQWSGNLSYRLSLSNVKTVRPLWFLADVPVLGLVGGLRLNVLPRSFRFTADANRNVTETQDRPRLGRQDDPLRAEAERLRPEFLYPLRRRHTFGHSRDLELQYSPFPFLAFTYRSNVRQSLNTAGVDERISTLVQSQRDPTRFEEYPGVAAEDVFALDEEGNPIGPGFEDFPISPDSVNALVKIYPTLSQVEVLPATRVLSDVLSGERNILTDSYQQNVTATVNSPFERVSALSWFRLQPVSFTSSFTWQFTPLPGVEPAHFADTTLVASLTNQASVRGGLSLRLRELFEKVGPYKRLLEAQEGAAADRRSARQRFEQKLAAHRTAQQQRDEAEAALHALEEEAAEALATADSLGAELAGRLEAAREALAERQAAADSLTRPSPPLPIPNPVHLLRRGFLALTGPRDLTLTYNGSLGGSASGVLEPGYSLLDALTGEGPPLGYRLGLRRRLDPEQRFFGDEGGSLLQVRDELRENHQFNARTSLEFSQALRADLTWDLGFSNTQSILLAREPGTDLVSESLTESGSGRGTIIGLGGSYHDLFERHRARLQEAIEAAEGGRTLETDALSHNAVVEDFRAAFLSGLGTFGRGGFYALPLPNWSITYTGIAEWPIIRSLTQSATLRHGYSATYDLGYRSNPAGGELSEPFRIPGGESFTLVREVAPFDVNAMRVSERFQPLVGLSLGFRGGFQADVNWNTSQDHALTPANASVSEVATRELSLRLNFSKVGLRLPLPFLSRRRLNNNFRFSLIVARAENTSRRFFLAEDLGYAFARDLHGATPPETFLNPQPEATTRLSVEPQISYTLSNQVTASIFVRYERFESEGSRNPSTTALNGGFNFRVSFSN